MANKNLLIDIDFYDRFLGDDPVIVRDKEAVSNALIAYLTSESGDYIKSTRGGILKRLLFKNINAPTVNKYRGIIEEDLNLNFTPFINIVEFDITSVPGTKKQVIKLIWAFPNESITDDQEVLIGLEDLSDIQVKNTIFTIFQSGDALINIINALSYENQGLPLDLNDENIYQWGRFVFPNLDSESPEFADIQAIILSSS